MENNVEIKAKIVEFLKNKRIGASSSEISKCIGHNRITVTKYLEILKAERVLDFEGVAQAKLWYVNSKPTVLVVDDEPHIVHLVALSMIPEKYNILKAYSGKEAMELVRNESPDIIILDLMMPGIDGYQVCRSVKENALTRHISIIILSAKGEIPDKLKGIQAGADDYLTKPFDPMELEARVQRVFRSRQEREDVHPLTKLPSMRIINEVLSTARGKKGVKAYAIKVIGLAEFSKKNGYSKSDFVITMTSRILKQAMSEDPDAFLGHTLHDTFVAVTKSDLSGVSLSFLGIIGYLYKDSLDLHMQMIEAEKIKGAGQAIDALGVI